MAPTPIDKRFFAPVDAHGRVDPPQSAGEPAWRTERSSRDGNAEIFVDENLHVRFESDADVEIVVHLSNVAMNARTETLPGIATQRAI